MKKKKNDARTQQRPPRRVMINNHLIDQQPAGVLRGAIIGNADDLPKMFANKHLQ